MRLMLSVFTALLFFTAMLPDRCLGVGYFEKLDVFSGVTPVPIVFDYVTCTARYRFCSCRLTGLANKEEVLERFDADGDGILSHTEMHFAVNSGVFTDEELGDTKFLACRFDPPSAGPYSQERCHALFGEEDCVCGHKWPEGYFCYSRSAVLLSPDQEAIPPLFCKTINGQPQATAHLSGEGFDCRCPETFTHSVTNAPFARSCYVIPPEAEADYECFDEIRIFPGDVYICVEKASGLRNFLYQKCCPNQIDCFLEEHVSDFDYIGASLGIANVSLKLYTAWRGYTGIYGSMATVGGFLQHVAGTPGEAMKTIIGLSGRGRFIGNIGSFVTGERFKGLVSTFDIYHSWGQHILGSTFSTLSTTLHYAGWAYAAFNLAKELFGRPCGPSDFALACKVRARLCIHVGDCKRKKFLGSIHKQVWICYNSQIARIVNEYGLPQIHAPGCHAENCSAASVDRERDVHPTNCGCEAAYTDGFGKCKGSDIKERARHRGFTPAEFERLDFAQIPLAEELSHLLLAKEEDFVSGGLDPSEVWQDPTSPVNQPSALETERAESSAEEFSETVREISETENTPAPRVGRCPSVFPVTASEAETYSPGSTFILSPCVKPKIEFPDDPELEEDLKVGRFYAFYLPVSEVCSNCARQGIDPESEACFECRRAHHHYECVETVKALGLPPETTTAYVFTNLEIEVPPIKDCVDVKHFMEGGFLQNGGLPPLPFPWSWSDFHFYRSSPSGPENFDLWKVSTGEDDPYAFAIGFVNFISASGLERGRLLSNGGACLLFKDRLPPSPCTHVECGRFVVGNEDLISPQCLGWINTVHNAFHARVDENCNIVPEEGQNRWGRKWLRIENFSALANLGNFTEGRDYFCSCPSYQEDVCLVEKGLLPEMVCPRPSRVNLVERMRINLSNGGFHDVYIDYPGYRGRYCWLDPLVASSCPCN